MRLVVENQSTTPKRVRCQWVVRDSDGDKVYAQRRVTLSPQRDNWVWLYAVPSVGGDAQAPWRVRVINDQDGRVLSTGTARPMRWLKRSRGVLGITGTAQLGLRPYASGVTRHEPYELLTGLEPAHFPDRWYGLSMLEVLVWTPESGDPGSALISADVRRAIRGWIRRGGHLVVVLPAVGGSWFESSLADVLPSVQVTRVIADRPPSWLGEPVGGGEHKIRMKVIEPRAGAGSQTSVLLRDHQGRPIVVAGVYGFGRVTLVGVDLTDPSIKKMGLPNGQGFWPVVLGWRGPAYTQSYIDQEIGRGRMAGAEARKHIELDRFIGHLITMRETVAWALLVAVIFFAGYWLLAGPVGFSMLSRCGLVRYSWLAFVVVVGVASVMAWGGAWVLGPGRLVVAHFTVLDGEGWSGLVYARSWLSLSTPSHGRVEVAIDSPEAGVPGVPGNTITGVGLGGRGSKGWFLDPQAYTLDASAPDRLSPPIRATAKQFKVDYLARRGGTGSDRISQWWSMPTGRLSVVDGWPAGTLVHNLPGALKNLLIVYCPGDGETPRVWRRRGPWAAGQSLRFEPPSHYEPLVRPLHYDQEGKRIWNQEGYLGRLIGFKTGQSWGDREQDHEFMIANSQIVGAVEMLSFYNALPPPDYRRVHLLDRAANYDRLLGGRLDLTSFTVMRCVILIGHLERASLPVPLRVDGQEVASQGWVVVRWIGPVHNP